MVGDGKLGWTWACEEPCSVNGESEVEKVNWDGD